MSSRPEVSPSRQRRRARSLRGRSAGRPTVSSHTAARGRRSTVARSRTSPARSEEHTSELQSRGHLVCRLLLEKKKKKKNTGLAMQLNNERRERINCISRVPKYSS